MMLKKLDDQLILFLHKCITCIHLYKLSTIPGRSINIDPRNF